MTFLLDCPSEEDPWADAEATPEHAAALRLVVLERRLRIAADRLGVHGPGAIAIAETIAKIRRLYSQDTKAWRRTRAFAVAHGPLLIETIEQLAKAGAPDDLADRLMACGRLADAALQAASEPQRLALEVSVETLEALVAPVAPAEAPVPASRGWFDRAAALIPAMAVPGRMSRVARALGIKLADDISAAATGTLAQAQVLTERAAAGLVDLADDAWRRLSDPVERTVGAALATASQTAVSAGCMALIGAVLFPPAAPFLIAVDLLKLDERYNQAIGTRIARQDAERAQRRRVRRMALEARIAQLNGVPRRLVFETDALSLTIDLDRMEVDGIILRGKHAGVALDRISDTSLAQLAHYAPDPETKTILEIVAGMRGQQSA